jgi:vancomycin resistance protein VanJ
VHLFAPFRVPPAVHDHYARALVEAIAAVEGPLIAGGDFNAAEPLTTYRLVSSYLRNAHWEAGWGFGFSYPAPPYTVEGVPVVTGPLYRIDHVFYNHYFVAGSARTLPAARGSDHLPVMAELFLVQPLSGPRTAAE